MFELSVFCFAVVVAFLTVWAGKPGYAPKPSHPITPTSDPECDLIKLTVHFADGTEESVISCSCGEQKELVLSGGKPVTGISVTALNKEDVRLVQRETFL